MSKIYKCTTNLTGLKANKHSFRILTHYYERILRALEKLPQSYPYRGYTEKLIKERAEIIKNTEFKNEIEKKIGCGQMEELVSQAGKELKLVKNILEWKAWETISSGNKKNQWLWPPST